MPRPFHYSFLVDDLAVTRRFYCGVLGCAEGRSSDTWIDFDFFGNQLSAHLGEPEPTRDLGLVDGVAVPMPHFGAVLTRSEFDELAGRLRESGTSFIIEPTIRFAGSRTEQSTMFFRDPSGNAIELKSFRDDSELFTRALS